MSDLLLDTHAVLWFFWDDPQLSLTAREAIEDKGNRKLVSVGSCWEIAIKTASGRLKLGSPCREFLSTQMSRNNFEALPINFEHATYVADMASHHKDPFDRLIIAQAIVEGMSIVSADAVFDRYGVSRIW